MNSLHFETPWALLALPLCLLPLWLPTGTPVANAWVAFTQPDRASRWLSRGLRAAAALALAAVVLALAGPYRPEYTVERVGQGAEIVLLLDRSRSMDQGFAPGTKPPPGVGVNSPEALSYYLSQSPGRLRDSKGKVARQLLVQFTAERPDDRFALVAFSTLPMRVLDFTRKPEIIRAAIEAGNVGRGLSETQIGGALDAALELFENRPYTGSRIVMLVSDGGDRMEPEARDRLAHRLRKLRVSVYWLYLRSANTPGLTLAAGDSAAAVDSVPELMLHRFFQSLETPYRVYEASDSEALSQAIADVNRQEKLPITYPELMPRRELAPYAQGLALLAVLLLAAAQALALRRWA